MKDTSGVLQEIEENGRIWVNQGTLNIKKVQSSDGGKYQCIVRNSIGERRIESVLVVTGTLNHRNLTYVILPILQKLMYKAVQTGN